MQGSLMMAVFLVLAAQSLQQLGQRMGIMERSSPSKPICLSVRANAVTISWTTVQYEASPTSYKILVRRNLNEEWIESITHLEGDNLQTTIKDLMYDTKYQFQVSAVYEDGISGSFSEPSESVTTEKIPTAAPTFVSSDPNEITISWCMIQPGPEPTYFQIRQEEESNNEWLESIFEKSYDKNHATIQNLNFDTRYKFQIRAVYENGEMSPYSETSEAMCTKRPSPCVPVLELINANSIVIKWTTDQQDIKPAYYLVRQKLVPYSEWIESIFDETGMKMQATIHNLKFDSQYQFQVRSVYPDGEMSPFSESSQPMKTERPPPTAPVCMSIQQNAITLSWSMTQEGAEPIAFEIRQRDKPGSKWIKSKFNCKDKMQATIHNLTFDSQYQFQVRSVYPDGEKSPFSKSSLPMKTERPHPSAPACTSLHANQITLSWSMIQYGTEPITFEIKQREESDSKWVRSKFYFENKMQATVQNLKYNTQYRFKVRAVYKNHEVSSYSEPSISVTSGHSPAANIIPLCTPATGKSQHPRQYNLPVIEDERLRDRAKMTRKSVVATGQLSSMEAEEKLVLMVGKRGAGKSTLIDGLANHLNGVVWEDDFRFRLTGTFTEKNSTSETTEWVTSYTIIPSSQNSSQSFILTIIDTPGFDDCCGSKRDEELVGRIQSFFPELHQQRKGTIDAVCFVTRSQITNQQTQIFDFMLSLFGKDIKDNIVVMATFADKNEPPVIESLRNAKVPYTNMFKFNNDCLFDNNKNTDPVGQFNWSMNAENFYNFISHLLQMPKRSLHLTSRVMDTRAIITTIIFGLHPLINGGLEDMKIIKTEKGLMNKFENDILQNKRFTYTITSDRQRYSELRKRTHVTNCLVCNRTCHYPCGIPDDEDKSGCSSMTNSYCRVCPGKCHWQHHKNNGYKIEWYKDEQEFTDEDMKRKYDIATQGKQTKENFIRELENAYKAKRNHVHAMLKKVLECKKFLTKNALKDSTLTAVTSIDLMIQTENEEKKPGYTERVELLKEFKREAEMLESENAD